MRMIQTVALANLVHCPHSQISMRILSRCLVLKIVISLKRSITIVFSWKKRAFVACQHRSKRFGFIVWTSTQNEVRVYSCRLCSSICCSAMQSTPQWTCSSGTSEGLCTQLNVFDVVVRRKMSTYFGKM